MPSPYGRQRPLNTLARSPSPEANSRTSRDLPTPAAPSTVTRWQARSDAAAANTVESVPCGRSRPTSGESRRGGPPAAPPPAGRGRPPRRGPGGDHLPGANPHAQRDPDAVALSELVAGLRQRLADLGGGAHGAEGVVLVEDRDPEHGHQRVARVGLDGAAVALEDAAHLHRRRRHEAPPDLRVEPVALRGGRSDGREQDRHRLAALVG